jgi:outer membrane protein OmpA-like peptidoglycan-associated protein
MDSARLTIVISVALVSILGTGCVSNKRFNATVKPLETRVTTVEGKSSELDKRTAENTSAISQLEALVSRVDERAGGADKSALKANEAAAKAAEEALRAAEQARAASKRAEDARAAADGADARVGKVIDGLDNYKLSGTESVLFGLNRADLNDDAKAKLDTIASQWKEQTNFVIEVQGFTDQSGSPEQNLELSRRRANAVVRYLTTNHTVPLRRIHVLGMGEEAPVADNKTREGRRENRRVELRVYAREMAADTKGAKTASSR